MLVEGPVGRIDRMQIGGGVELVERHRLTVVVPVTAKLVVLVAHGCVPVLFPPSMVVAALMARCDGPKAILKVAKQHLAPSGGRRPTRRLTPPRPRRGGGEVGPFLWLSDLVGIHAVIWTIRLPQRRGRPTADRMRGADVAHCTGIPLMINPESHQQVAQDMRDLIEYRVPRVT